MLLGSEFFRTLILQG